MILEAHAARAGVKASLMPISVVRSCLGIDEDKVLALIETGALRWAWDIAARSAGRKIREIRVWSPCVAVRQAGGTEQPGKSSGEVIAAVVGCEGRKNLSASEVRDLLLCSQQTVSRLMDGGELQGETTRRARWVDRQGLVEFLNRRLL